MKRTHIYGIILLAGCLCIGLGSGVTALEFSSFTSVNYDYNDTTNNFPLLETEKKEITVPLNQGQPISFDSYWSDITVEIDNNLGNEAIIESNIPSDLYRFWWERYDTKPNGNAFFIHVESDPFRSSKLFFQLLKEDYVITGMPDPKFVIRVNETYAATFTTHHGYYPEGYEASRRYEEERSNLQEHYEEQINELQNRYEEQINISNEQMDALHIDYEERIQQLHTDYEDRLEQERSDYESRIDDLQEQINNLRNS